MDANEWVVDNVSGANYPSTSSSAAAAGPATEVALLSSLVLASSSGWVETALADEDNSTTIHCLQYAARCLFSGHDGSRLSSSADRIDWQYPSNGGGDTEVASSHQPRTPTTSSSSSFRPPLWIHQRTNERANDSGLGTFPRKILSDIFFSTKSNQPTTTAKDDNGGGGGGRGLPRF